MGGVLSFIASSILAIIYGVAKLFGGPPEQENPTVIAVREQGGRITDWGFTHPSPNFEKMERISRYLQIDMAGNKLSPTVWPTEEEFSDAKERFEYIPGNLHLAVTGIAGSGKSPLVNAFRGLRVGDSGAAETGVIETTKEAARYPHPEKEPPLARIVCAYFNAQGLFIFDFIIVVTGDRFTEQDLSILANCEMSNIPFFVVCSKADMHIQNMERDKGLSYEDARRRYTDETRNYLMESLRVAAKKIKLDIDKEIFLVSNNPLRDFVRSVRTAKHRRTPKQLLVNNLSSWSSYSWLR